MESPIARKKAVAARLGAPSWRCVVCGLWQSGGVRFGIKDSQIAILPYLCSRACARQYIMRHTCSPFGKRMRAVKLRDPWYPPPPL